ncbi:MAG: VWA domain-containing protein [Candidatus Neomarinimicrobiota bacterium]
MSFRYDWVLFLLLIQFLYWLLLYFKKDNQRDILSNVNDEVYNFLIRKVSFNSIKIKSRLIFLGLFFLTISASGPLIGTRVRPVERKGVDLVIVLDTSKSMDAKDVTPSRLAKAKFELNKLIKNLSGDRVSIIVFAGSSHLYLPLTTDYEAALLFLNEIETDMIPNQGTSLSSALNTAFTSFTEEFEKFKVVLLVTDGEDHEGEAIDVAKKASMDGMIINTVAVGSSEGGLIPIKSNSKYKRDKKGRLVTSKVDQAILQEIAQAGRGSFYWFSNNRDSYIDIENGINKMEKKIISTHEFSEYDDRYQLIGLISLFLILLSFIYPTKGKELK